MLKTLGLAGLVAAASCVPVAAMETNHFQTLTPDHIQSIDDAFNLAVARGGIDTAAVGLMQGGKLIWTAYYGEHRAGVPASADTQFNVGSITKTVSAETVLRLVANGRLDLDESMAAYWVDPDIADDPRHQALTPRMALTHTTGLPNWRWFTDNYKLQFLRDPGADYGYSGEGFQYMARYVEAKLEQDFESLVKKMVFEPVGITQASFSRREANFPNIAETRDAEGNLVAPYCRPGGKYCVEEGGYSAAGNMVITLPEYARFLTSVMKGEGYDTALKAERNRVQAIRPVRYCDTGQPECPKRQGYGLGWVVVDTAKDKLLWHGGSDWSLVTSAYFYEKTGEGLIIFLNGVNARAMDAMPGLIRLFDPASPIIDQYELWAARE